METQLEISIEEIIQRYTDVVFMVEQGQASALPVYSELDVLEKAIKGLKKEIQDEAIEAAGKYHKNDRPVYFGKMPTVSSKKTYSYKHDDTWNSYEAKKKERESLMKKAMKANIIDPDTGEMIPPAEFKESTFIKMENA